MKKILRSGWGTRKITCTRCGTKFEFEEDDTYITTKGHMQSLKCEYVRCPKCDNELVVRVVGLSEI